MITFADAVQNLSPRAAFITKNNKIIEWHSIDIPQPTSAEIDAEVVRLQAVYDAQAYARSRKAKYDLLNQDEMRYDDLINSTTTWQDAIATIKTEFPKG